MKKRDPALERAIKLAGGVTALAKALGAKSTQRISNWHQCPAECALAVEAATGGKVTRYQLRPDIFGRRPPAPTTQPSP